jgi:predicted lipoprotein with Yx(FWY)xxD motif
MKRTYLISATVLALGASLVTTALAQPSRTRARASRSTVVSLRHTSLGSILVSASGRTLYEFTRDHPGRDSCASIKGCSEIWPPLTSPGHLSAGPGLHGSLLSSIKLANGSRQLTYAGHPLYLYSGDSGPGETSYVGANEFGGSWYAVNSAGHSVK